MGVSNAWGKTFYLKPNLDWKSKSAKFAICYGYDNSTDQNFVEMTVVSGTDWYSADVPNSASSKNIYFMRVPSTWKVTDKWNNKWNGFGWFSYSNGSHYFTDSWDGGSKFDVGFEGGNNGIKYWREGDANDTEWSFSGKDAQIKNLEEVTKLNLKQWFTQMYENKECWDKTTVFKYNIHRTAAAIGSYLSSGHNWEEGGNLSGGYRNPKIGNNNLDINLLENLGSGKYTMSFFYEDTKLCITSPIHKLNWTYNIVPDVKNFKVTANKNNVVSGTGTLNDPYIIACGKSMTLTVSGEKASTDANSSLNASFGNNTSYSTTLTKTYSSIPASKQSVKVYAKFYNSDDALSGTPTETTIYYQAQTFAVKITSSGNGTVTPSGTQQVGATNFNITATPKIGSAFKQWEVTGGAKVADATSATTTITATSAGTVKAVFEEKPATTVYLKTTANWKDANARFAIYYWGANDQNGWVNMTEVDCNRDYFKGEIPYGSTGFNFVRMNPNALANNWDNDWNQTGNISVPTDSKNCFTITNDHWGEQDPTAEGTWGAFNPTVTLTLKSSSNGTYKITYEGKTYESSLTEDVLIPNLPLDAKIIISESASPNAGYWLKERFIKLGTNEKVGATTNTTYTLCGNTTISANFVTKWAHTVYFKPNSNWTIDNARFAIYAYDEAGEEKWYNLTNKSGGYYTCEIEKGWSNIIFVRMDPTKQTNNWDNKWNQTLSHAIPVNRFNTYVLRDEKWGTEPDEGYWTASPTLSGAYRLRYVEQLVEHDATETWKVEINETQASHAPDDVIQQRANGRDTISLFINIDGDNPEVILQQYNGSKWVDIEAHMVNGPLEADASMAMLPGRKNASPDSDIDDFVYDDGIDAITESGVWNFIIVQDAEGEASLLLKEDDKDVTHKYTGNYYIRTNNAAGGWNTYTHPDNIMSRSTYSESGYTHYYCKWVNITESNITTAPENVKYIVATDYCINVSREFAEDDYTKDDGVLVENANVRWSWDENTGVVARAYIQGAYNPSTSQRLNNIVLDYTTDGTNNPEDETLDDSGDWIYTKDITVNPGATLESLRAKYPSEPKEGVSPQIQDFAEEKTMLEGEGEGYTVRVLYDFKENETMIWLLPTEGATTAIDVLIERVNHDEATQVAVEGVTAATAENEGETGFTVYAAISFEKDFVNDTKKSKDLRQFYWISFPFEVDMKDVFGFGEYGTHWILEYYDGERRAKDGLWLDSPSFWEYIIDTTNFVIEANKGYVLCLDLETMGTESEVFQNTDKVTLYFPSKEKLTTINQEYTITEVDIPPHICNIQRADRYIYDSNWNLIGVPSYANKDFTSYPDNLQYFYEYNPQDDPDPDYTIKSSTNANFNSMYAYFVQWGGTIEWTQLALGATPQEMQAKKNADYEAKEHNLRLELQHNAAYTDQTFVALKEEGATAAFDLNLDLTKISGTCSGIYTLAGEENIQLAGNVLPLEDNTIIPVGVQVAKAGEYTFAMPDGTDGIVVELIDYETNTRTNLLLDEYTVNLGKGTFESRFALHVKPDKTVTSVEDINTNSDGVRKFIIDGVLYMQKDGALYDAQGRCVQ